VARLVRAIHGSRGRAAGRGLYDEMSTGPNQALLAEYQQLQKDWSKIFIATQTWNPNPGAYTHAAKSKLPEMSKEYEPELMTHDELLAGKERDDPSKAPDIVKLKELFLELKMLKSQGGFDEGNAKEPLVSEKLNECKKLLEPIVAVYEAKEQEAKAEEMQRDDSGQGMGL
jgi:hypothetical protein